MKTSVLTLRLNRRAIGVAALSDEALTLAQGRHVTSRAERGHGAAVKYVSWLLDLTKPSVLAVDAPTGEGTGTTGRILRSVLELAAERSIPVLLVTKPEILTAFGQRPVRNRRELRELVRTFWSELANIRGQVEPYVVDAAAAALYADCKVALERVTA